MSYYCGECKQPCGVQKEDLSFSHEFGVEERFAYSSDCCGGDLYQTVCESCGGTGEIIVECGDGVIASFTRNGAMILADNGKPGKIDTCDDCNGKGVSGLVEISDDDDLIDHDLAEKNRGGD